MPIYIDKNSGVKYAYSTLGNLDDTETADVISSTGVSGNIIILSSFKLNDKTYIVTSIGHNAFRNCNGLATVVIPNSITSIGDYAFGSCSGLLSVELPNSVISIGYYAFGSCCRLSSIVIPNSVTSIGPSAFYYCTSLTTVFISNSITSIGANTFICCSSLMSINIPDGVTSIGANAFAYCSKLTTITIPDNVANIGSNAFSHCSRISTIIIPNKVTNIGINAFNSCVRLSSVTFTNNIITIEQGAFDELAFPSTAYIPVGFTDKQIKHIRLWFTNITMIHTPIISYITPNEGYNSVPSKVTITGKSLINITTVLFGTNKSPNIVILNDTTIDVVAPIRVDTGSVDVTVVDIYDKTYTLTDGYTYTALVPCMNSKFITDIFKRGIENIIIYLKSILKGSQLLDKT